MTTVSIATLKQCTEQEVFDHVYRGLAAQGFQQSMVKYVDRDISGSCMYFGPEGRRCAAGQLFAEGERGLVHPRYNESTNWDSLVSNVSAIPTTHMELIGKLQSAHDKGSNPQMMKALLRDVATDYGLVVPTL